MVPVCRGMEPAAQGTIKCAEWGVMTDKNGETPTRDVIDAVQNLARSEMLLIVEQCLDELEMSAGERNAFLRRLGKKAKLPKIPENISTQWLIDQVEQKAALALSYIDEFTLMRASARDLATVANVMLEKRQLLRGEPTSIVSNEERRAMDEVLPYLLKVAHDRGITVDLGPDQYSVSDQAAASGLEKVTGKRPEKYDINKLPPLLKKRPRG